MNARTIIAGVLAFVGFYLLRLGTASESLSGAMQFLALIAGLVLFIGTLVWLMRGYTPQQDTIAVRNPTLAHFLFESPRSAALWLGARIYLGVEWIDAGWHKVTDSAWMDGGAAVQGYWERAVLIPEQGRPAVTYDWYRDFLQGLIDGGHAAWFGPLIAIGEVLVGVALFVGALVGIAAFFGALMNMSFMLAGSASTNPILFTLSIGLILAWKVAGYIGLDRLILPRLGAPWNPGTLFKGTHKNSAHSVTS